MNTDLPREQTDFFRSESLNYFRRNYEGRDLTTMPVHPHLKQLLEQRLIDVHGGVLDVGCCPGANLHELSKILSADRYVGTEPSPEVAALMKAAFPQFEFHPAVAHQLPFQTGEFELVLMRGVITWVDPDHLLQSLGEAIRVSNHYFIISEFSPRRRYSVVYHHQPRYRTYKMDHLPLLQATGLVRCLASFVTDNDDEWNACRTSLYEKLPLSDTFPLREEKDFRPCNQ